MPAVRTNPIRAALNEKRLIRGPFQMFNDPAITEIIIGGGFDYVLIDAEHRAFAPDTIETLIRAAQGAGGGAMIRVPTLNRAHLQHALDAGADAVLVPLVNSRREAEEAVSFSRLPPLGTRGFNGGTRAGNWGAPDLKAYVERVNREIVVAVQIETPAALANVAEIAATPGLDLIYIGPFDLSHGMGKVGQLDDPEVRGAIERICAAARKEGKALGILAPTPEFAKWSCSLGVQLLTYRSDIRYFKLATAAAVEELKSLV